MDIASIDNQIKYLESMKRLLLEPLAEDASLDTIIYKKYFELENVSEVAKWLNENGYRTESKSTGADIKYNSNDVTARLTDKKSNVSEDLKECVQLLFKKHKHYANRRWN